MSAVPAVIATALVLSGSAFALRALRRRRRIAHIAAYDFPASIPDKIRRRYPHLESAQTEQVLDGLRDYFVLCATAGRRIVAMPSQAVDCAWHEFILFTRAYQRFCDDAFGRFLHHTPAERMEKPTLARQGIKRAWRLACAKEKIDRMKPERLPLLFALDASLAIADGFTYELDCRRKGSDAYCASHIGCSGGCTSCGGDSGCGGGCGGD